MSRSSYTYTDTASSHTPRIPYRSAYVGLLAIGLMILCSTHCVSGQPPVTQEIAASTAGIAETGEQPQVAWRLQEGVVKKGQQALSIFHHAGVNTAQVLQLRRSVRAAYDINRLRVGRFYRIQVDAEGQLQRFIYHINTEKQLRVEWHDQRFVGDVEPIPYVQQERLVSGRIVSSLSQALVAQGESVDISEDVATIFSREIDIDTDLHPGDTFHFLIEEHWPDGATPHYHRILAAELVSQGRVFQAVYYDGPNAEGYYLPDGRSLQGLFLRAPLHYTRISSHFSPRRFHPILKCYRPHWGVDYAAPYGTPIYSIGDGTIQWMGVDRQGGQMIRIRHARGYVSYYLHLSRFASTVNVGTQVEKGQVIGYVGATGLATGPHLDFRLKQHGRYLNPLTHDNVEAPPLPRHVLPTFQPYVQRLLAKLHEDDHPVPAALTVASRE